MTEGYKIAYQGGVGEIVEKKSRFISSVFPIESEEEALEILEKTRKKYWDATHNCFAYVIGKKNEVQRCSDDGEPQGTAGRPMLDVLLGEEVHNVLVIVTRYFGGTLLGTGGLVRAYSKSVQEGLRQSVIVKKEPGCEYEIITDYTGIGKIQYLIVTRQLTVSDTEYCDVVKVYVLVPEELCNIFEKEVTEATSGRARIRIQEKLYYGVVDGQVIRFE